MHPGGLEVENLAAEVLVVLPLLVVDDLVRPISRLTLPLLILLDSNFPGKSQCTWKFHPFKLR